MKSKSMKSRLFAAVCALTMLTGCSEAANSNSQTNSGGNTASNNTNEEITVMKDDYTRETLDEYVVPEWYRDAKFGIFIHYGVYSVPAYTGMGL